METKGALEGPDGSTATVPGQVPGQPVVQGQPPNYPMPPPSYAQIPPGQMGQPGMPGQPQNYRMHPMASYGNPVPGSMAGPVPLPLPRMDPIAGVPPGLEYLVQIDQLLVHQRMELLEMLTTWETNNKYLIKNSTGQQVYYAAEESNLCMRQLCGPSRGFVIHITDNFGNEVIQISRDFKCCAGASCCACIDCCSFEVTVEAPVGNVIGYVKQEWSCLKPNLVIQDANHEPILRVTGPICPCQCICCPKDLPFEVMTADGCSEVGVITKQWGGVLQEMVADADMFGVKFPADLDVRVKATTLAAVFLIDFMYFETKKQNNNRR